MSVSETPDDAILGTFGGHDAAPSLGTLDSIIEGLRLETPRSCDEGKAIQVLCDNIWPADNM